MCMYVHVYAPDPLWLFVSLWWRVPAGAQQSVSQLCRIETRKMTSGIIVIHYLLFLLISLSAVVHGFPYGGGSLRQFDAIIVDAPSSSFPAASPVSPVNVDTPLHDCPYIGYYYNAQSSYNTRQQPQQQQQQKTNYYQYYQPSSYYQTRDSDYYSNSYQSNYHYKTPTTNYARNSNYQVIHIINIHNFGKVLF